MENVISADLRHLAGADRLTIHLQGHLPLGQVLVVPKVGFDGRDKSVGTLSESQFGFLARRCNDRATKPI